MKSPPSTYLSKIKSFYQDQVVVSLRVSPTFLTSFSRLSFETCTLCDSVPLSLTLLLHQLRKRIQDATKVLKDLEISLRTNHIG